MKKAFYFSLVVIISFCALGMGGVGQESLTVPEPEENYLVSLIDQSDVSIELENFSCAGFTYFGGKLGKADISISFDKIDSVSFLLNDNDVKAIVSLKDGKIVELLVDRDKPCYGVASFADVRIEIQDIKKITILKKIQKN
jgi:hypothetical protein